MGSKYVKAKCNGYFTFESVTDSWGAQIVHIFHGDWIHCRGTSILLLFFVCSAVLCNRLYIAESEAEWPLHF